jgi:hypothetical protein
MENERAREIAIAAGMPALDGKHLTQLANSIASGRDLGGQLPKDLHWSEEIALIFRLPSPASARR